MLRPAFQVFDQVATRVMQMAAQLCKADQILNWVQCDSCSKWRASPSSPSLLADGWKCKDGGWCCGDPELSEDEVARVQDMSVEDAIGRAVLELSKRAPLDQLTHDVLASLQVVTWAFVSGSSDLSLSCLTTTYGETSSDNQPAEEFGQLDKTEEKLGSKPGATKEGETEEKSDELCAKRPDRKSKPSADDGISQDCSPSDGCDEVLLVTEVETESSADGECKSPQYTPPQPLVKQLCPASGEGGHEWSLQEASNSGGFTVKTRWGATIHRKGCRCRPCTSRRKRELEPQQELEHCAEPVQAEMETSANGEYRSPQCKAPQPLVKQPRPGSSGKRCKQACNKHQPVQSDSSKCQQASDDLGMEMVLHNGQTYELGKWRSFKSKTGYLGVTARVSTSGPTRYEAQLNTHREGRKERHHLGSHQTIKAAAIAVAQKYLLCYGVPPEPGSLGSGNRFSDPTTGVPPELRRLTNSSGWTNERHSSAAKPEVRANRSKEQTGWVAQIQGLASSKASRKGNKIPRNLTQRDGLVASGYSNFLIKHLINGPPREKHSRSLDIRLESMVTNVLHGDNGCTVILSNRQEIKCDAVVVTLPLGVLQASLKSASSQNQSSAGLINFEPPLSHRKQLAIERLGFGTENKVVLRFRFKFWPNEPFLQCTDHRFRFLNLDYYGKPNVVVAHVAPPFSIGFDGLSDSQVVELTASIFGSMFRYINPEVIASTVTHWERDEFSRGSYSFAKLGSDVTEESIALGMPEGRLFFAGEACNPANMQCVHGAFLSGQGTARDVAEALGNQKLSQPYS